MIMLLVIGLENCVMDWTLYLKQDKISKVYAVSPLWMQIPIQSHIYAVLLFFCRNN